jgi:N-acylneuraminate cytidylyltransferase
LNSSFPDPSSVHSVVFDFDGIFTDNKVWVDQDGRELVCCDRGDGLAFDILRKYRALGKLNADIFILSTERNPVVLARARKLGATCHQGVGNKLDFMENHLRQTRPADTDPWRGVIYLGNDLNDLPVLRRAGFSVAPADAHLLVREIASEVLPQMGGAGFVRAFVESWLGIGTMSASEIEALFSN